MADWYRDHNVSPESMSEAEYRDWLAVNVSVEEADRFWYSIDDTTSFEDENGRTS